MPNMAGTTTNNGWDYPTSTDYVYQGALAIQTLATDIDTSVGSGLLAWQTYAPTLSGGWANGNGVYVARYAQLGKTVHVYIQFTVGSTTTKGSGLQVSLPVTGSQTNYSVPVRAICASSNAVLLARATSSTVMTIEALNSAGTYLTNVGVTSTIPGTWATSDIFVLAFTYQAA